MNTRSENQRAHVDRVGFAGYGPDGIGFQPPRQTAGDDSSSPAGFALLSPVGGFFKRLFKRASKQAETIAPLDHGRGAFSERDERDRERRAFWALMLSIVAMCAVMSFVTRSSRPASTGTLAERPALAVGTRTDAPVSTGGRLDLLEKRLDRMEREQRSANAAWIAIWERIDRKLPDLKDGGLRLPGIRGQVKR